MRVAAETSLMAPHRPADPHQLVRQSHRRIVVTNTDRGLYGPALQRRQFLRRACLTTLGRQQRRKGAMDQQGAHDMPQLAPLAAAELAGRQHTSTTDLIQLVHHLIVGVPALELVLALGHALLMQVDLRQDDMQLRAQGLQLGALDQFMRDTQKRGRRGRGFDTRLTQNAAQQVDPLGAALLPGFPQPMQQLHLLLLVAFHRHRINILAARGLQHRIAVIAIRLVATAIGAIHYFLLSCGLSQVAKQRVNNGMKT